jgi:hypothetical protein
VDHRGFSVHYSYGLVLTPIQAFVWSTEPMSVIETEPRSYQERARPSCYTGMFGLVQAEELEDNDDDDDDADDVDDRHGASLESLGLTADGLDDPEYLQEDEDDQENSDKAEPEAVVHIHRLPPYPLGYGTPPRY